MIFSWKRKSAKVREKSGTTLPPAFDASARQALQNLVEVRKPWGGTFLRLEPVSAELTSAAT